MKERPILFSGPMVRAILDERKTQTRRAINPQPHEVCAGCGKPNCDSCPCGTVTIGPKVCPYGRPGDRLWVKETFLYRAQKAAALYRSDMDPAEAAGVGAMYGGWKPSIFMSRAFSRISLEVTDIGVQRVQEISEEDAQAEGITIGDALRTNGQNVYPTRIDAFQMLWDSINAKRGFGWDKNPWVWAITFKRV